MNQPTAPKRKKPPGFTLIEMLIVIFIIGTLTGIGVPALLDSRDAAREAKKATIINQIQTAKSRYALENSVNITTVRGATFAEIKPYLVQNAQVPAIQNITSKNFNGLEENIARFGNYPRNSGTNATLPLFSPTLPPLLNETLSTSY